MNKLTFTEQQKEQLRACYESCIKLFFSDVWKAQCYDEDGCFRENVNNSNYAHRFVCAILLKARDMNLIPYFEVSDDCTLGFDNAQLYALYCDSELFENCYQAAFNYYGWEMPCTFNYSTYDESLVTDINVEVLYNIANDLECYSEIDVNILRNPDDIDEDERAELLSNKTVIGFCNEKFSVIQMYHYSHRESSEDQHFMTLFNKLNDYFERFSTIDDEALCDNIYLNNQYIHYAVAYDVSDESGYIYERSQEMSINPAGVFLLQPMDELMDEIIKYINQKSV